MIGTSTKFTSFVLKIYGSPLNKNEGKKRELTSLTK